MRLDRVCSVMRSKDKNFIFFEDAKYPVLSIEAQLPAKTQNPYLASLGWAKPQTVAGKLVLLEAVSLTGVNLIAKKFETKVYLHKAMEKLKKEYPRDWKNSLVQLRVCDDTNRDNMCSNEDARHTLSISTMTLKPTALPKSVRLEVWSGRFLTLAANPNKCEQQYSPLVLDLSGGGFQFSSAENGVWFDLDDSGETVRTAWMAGSSNALLCRDRNANGQIDSGAELFGTATRLINGKRAANGFEALVEYDTNGDNLITPSDSIWKELRLWIDSNHDGISDRRELYPLHKGNLRSINLNYVAMDETDANGNTTKYRSTYNRMVDGIATPLQIIDVWFNTLIAN